MRSTRFYSLYCGTPKCEDRIALELTSQHDSHGQTGGHIDHALRQAAAYIGWRLDITPLGPLAPGAVANQVCCPRHADGLICARCQSPTAEDGSGGCSCEGGPRYEAVRP